MKTPVECIHRQAPPPPGRTWEQAQEAASVMVMDCGTCECCGDLARGAFSSGRYCSPCGVQIEEFRRAKIREHAEQQSREAIAKNDAERSAKRKTLAKNREEARRDDAWFAEKARNRPK